MTKDTLSETAALRVLLSETPDAHVLAEMLGFVADRLMALDVDQLCGAGAYERSADRANHRNGYRARAWNTRAGTVDVQIPKLRKGTYFPDFLEPRRVAEKAMTAVIQEAYVQGLSTRSVDDLVKAMGMTGVSKSQVSRLCGEIDERVNAFLNRPLEGEWPYVWLDATYIKVRRSGRIVSVAAIVAVAVNLDGRREVLGIAVPPSEAEVFWDEFLRSLADRGLRGTRLIIAPSRQLLRNHLPGNGRPQGPEGCCIKGFGGHNPALSRPLHAERARLRQQEGPPDRDRGSPNRLRSGHPEGVSETLGQAGRGI